MATHSSILARRIPMDRGAWRATVHGVPKSWAQLSKHSTAQHIHLYMCVCSVQPHGLYPARLLCPWVFPGKNSGVGCHFLLQGIFLTQGSNPNLLCLLHCQAHSLLLSHQGSPGDRNIYTKKMMVISNTDSAFATFSMCHILFSALCPY